MKKMTAILLVLAMMIGMCTFAAAEPSIAGQYYSYAFTAEGYGDYSFFFHFYEEDPVLGAVFYAGLSNNRINFSGLYTVEAAPYEYNCYATRAAAEAGELTAGTAPYTIHFLDWKGNEFESCGWDGQILYNDCTEIKGAGSGPNFYHLDQEGKLQSAYDAEVGVPYLDFVAVDDTTCTVSLCHNKTYIDMMMYYIDGSWTIADGENGASVFTFQPFDESEDVVTLTVAADQKTAVYTYADGSEVEMINAAKEEPKALYAGQATFTVEAYGTDATITLTLFDDGNATLTATFFGNSAVVDQGPYTMNADHSVTFQFEKIGEAVAKLDLSVGAVVLNYSNENTQLGAMTVALPIRQAE